ncbi:MAG: hypothetical protein RLY58_832 [Pseudomonadota bacterium]|jgi:phage tail protein X
MSVISSLQNDTVDQLCHRHLGRTGGVTEQVFDLNPHLALLPPVLPSGISITLPVTPAQLEHAIVQLWD